MKYLVVFLLGLIVVDAVSISDVKKEVLRDLLLRKLRNEIQEAENAEPAEPAGSGSKQESESSESSESSASSASGESIRDEILHMEDLYMQYFKEQDFEALSNLYTDDASYYAPGEAPVYGKEAIEDNVWIPGAGGGEENKEILTFESTNIIDAGDHQIGHGTWDVKENPDVVGTNNLIADGVYLTVYKKVDGQWLIEVDIINITNLYPPTEDEEDAVEEEAEEAEEAAAAGEGATKRRLVKALKRLLARSETKRSPGVLHRIGGTASRKVARTH